eukprot:m.102230 g.102230  ORF g.102230 m.102230 type:complete len:195 (+) comp18765_c0_seq1:25-609(+)
MGAKGMVAAAAAAVACAGLLVYFMGSSGSQQHTVHSTPQIVVEERRPRVRRRSKRRVVTCCGNELLFSRLGGALVADNTALAVICQLCKELDVFVIVCVADDNEEALVWQLLRAHGALDNGLDKRRVLFCSEPRSVVHMVRHLSPAVHIDAHKEHVELLHPHLPNLFHVARQADWPRIPDNVHLVNSVQAIALN